VAVDAARTAGAVLLSRWGRRGAGLSTKTTSTDVVLDADRAAEAEVVRILQNAYPGDSIVAEEGSGSGVATSAHRWYVDPLDGTVNYLYGIPHFAVAIACEDDDGLLAAVVYDPSRDELFSAARGAGAWLGASQLRVSTETNIGKALVATGFAYVAAYRHVQAKLLPTVLPEVRDIRRMGSAALDLAWVAGARFDAYFETGVQPWDVMAGTLLVREAGGVVSSVQGLGGDRRPGVVATNPEMHTRLMRLLSAAE
jgi:myo-inositol-1(or 4)-monophosphatase